MRDAPQLSRSHLKHFQKERIAKATLEAIAEKGYRSVTVSRIVRGAGIARNTFYENFSSKADALEDAVEGAVNQAIEEIGSGEDGDVFDRLGAYIEANQAATRCVLVEAMSCAPLLYETAIEEVIAKVGLEGEVGRMVVGGMAAIIYRSVVAGENLDIDGLRAFAVPHFPGVLQPA